MHRCCGVFCPEPEERRLAWDGAWSFRLSCRANLASLRYRRPRLRRSCSPHFHSAAMGRQRIWTELNLAGRCRQYFGNPSGLDARGGLEWLFLQNWNVKVEYLYYNLGNVQFASSPLTTILPIPPSFELPTAYNVAIPITHTRFDGNIFRAGLNLSLLIFNSLKSTLPARKSRSVAGW
jgi:hypothetical protein